MRYTLSLLLALESACLTTAAPASAQPASGSAPNPVPHAALTWPTIAIDERLAADVGLHVGERVVIAGQPGAAAAGTGDTVVIGAVVARTADPSEVARPDYRIRVHLPQLQRLTDAGDRVDRFALRTSGGSATDATLARVNAAAFGFRAYRSADVAVRTSRTFQVVNRFHEAIAFITIVACGIFLLCILLLRVEERRRDIAALRLIGISRGSVVRSVMIEAALISLVGSALGTFIGYVGSLVINWHYRGVYRTPLAFSVITPGIVYVAVALAIILGIGAGFLAATRLVRTPPLALFGR